MFSFHRVAVIVTLASVATGITTSALASVLVGKRCIHASCGGALDQACAGSGDCRFCDGSSAYTYLCFNATSTSFTCTTVGGHVQCGKVNEGTCVSNSCINSVALMDDCFQAKCTP